MIESVDPENVRGEDTVSVCIAEVPLPTRIPESVVEPVPPFATGSIPVRLFTPIDVVAIILPVESVANTEPVSAVKYALPETVSAVVEAFTNCDVDDAWIPFVNQIGVEVELAAAPKLVVGVNGKICESDELDTLLLKVVQSAKVRKPLVDALAA